jgi:DNA-binding response OmpR family regulator
MHILLIEDDDLVGEAIQVGLQLQGVTVDWIADGEQADQALRDDAHELVVLDLALPRRGGLDLLREYRKRGGQAPVLILTAFNEIDDRVAGLEIGADDYLAKPFDLQELGARLRALQRRLHGRTSDRLQHAGSGLEFDPANLTAFVEGEPVDLPRREAVLLQVLLENQGQVVTLERIHDRLYGWDDAVASNAPAVHVHNLRRKFGRDLIETVRGIGYRLASNATLPPPWTRE